MHAIELARRGSDTLRDLAASDPRRHGEHVAALLRVADLHLRGHALASALKVLDQVVTVVATNSPDPTRLADVLARRGNTRRLAGAYDDARADLDRALALPARRLTLAGVHNAAGILAKDTGRFDAAADHYRQALAELRAVLGDDQPGLAAVHHNLAGLAHARGQHRDGEPYIRRALALREQDDSTDTAGDLAVLGALLLGQGREQEAEAALRRSLELWSRHRCADHYEVAVALHHLARLHQDAGALQTATQELQRAWSIKHAVLGAEHPETCALRIELDTIGSLT